MLATTVIYIPRIVVYAVSAVVILLIAGFVALMWAKFPRFCRKAGGPIAAVSFLMLLAAPVVANGVIPGMPPSNSDLHGIIMLTLMIGGLCGLCVGLLFLGRKQNEDDATRDRFRDS